MSISTYTLSTAIDVPVYTSKEDIRTAMSMDAGMKILQKHMIRGLPQKKDDLEPSLDR